MAKSFKTGDLVTVTPKADDVFQNEFTGTIIGTHSKYWQVEDQEGECWDADEDQMKHADEE